MLLLGAHVSTSGGVHLAPLNGEALGCTAIQIFTKNQRQWSAKPLSEEETASYFANLKKTSIRSVVAHNTYLINMASPDPSMREKSTGAFIDEIRRAGLLKLDGLVLHPGSHLGAGDEKGVALMVESLNRAAVETSGNTVRILIENTAGQGTNLGYRFEHLRDILAGMREPARFGVCLDTCHMFTSGYSIAAKESYGESMRKLEEIIGIDKVRCVHVNDSKQPEGSRRDRHENIGKGLIPKKGFALLMNDKRFENVPKILETPGGDEWYKKDLKVLKGMIKDKTEMEMKVKTKRNNRKR
jgi:deoxyribonuclease-4